VNVGSALCAAANLVSAPRVPVVAPRMPVAVAARFQCWFPTPSLGARWPWQA